MSGAGLRLVVSGASGFVGAPLVRALASEGHSVVGLVRRAMPAADPVRYVCIDERSIAPDSFASAMQGADVVVHLAARTHSADLRDPAARALYTRTNVDFSLALAEASVRAGVRRFVFMSSVKACGESSGGQPLRETDVPRPEDLYGLTKLEAEDRLLAVAARTGMDVVVVRPPLIYGPGAKANFLRLLSLVHAGWPLPFGSIVNLRSVIGLSNLIDAVRCVIAAPVALAGRYFVRDARDVSTRELIALIATLMHKKPRLIAVPAGLLRVLAKGLGQADRFDKLTGSLQVDSSLLRRVLGWEPPVSLEQELQSTVQWFLQERAHEN